MFVIVALDFSNDKETLTFIEKLDPSETILKVGSELFSHCGPVLVRQLIQKGFKIFLDLKFHDIPNTVTRACQACAELGVWMLNVHAAGGTEMMTAASKALASYHPRPLLIAVTVLTSMSEHYLPAIGINNSTINQQVLRLATLAYESGLDGVVSSAFEVPLIKNTFGQDFLTITPGIRFEGENAHDQVRIVTPKMAVDFGADFLVIGRSLTKLANPAATIKELNLLKKQC